MPDSPSESKCFLLFLFFMCIHPRKYAKISRQHDREILITTNTYNGGTNLQCPLCPPNLLGPTKKKKKKTTINNNHYDLHDLPC